MQNTGATQMSIHQWTHTFIQQKNTQQQKGINYWYAQQYENILSENTKNYVTMISCVWHFGKGNYTGTEIR